MTQMTGDDSPALAHKPGVPVVRALDRGVALLQSFTAARPRLTLAELARAAELDRGTARRLLQTLRLAGLVEHDELSGRYFLGIGVLELAAAVEIGRDLREIAEPYLIDLANRTGAVAFLWSYGDGQALCLARVKAETPAVEATWFPVGGRTPLNCGGGPKALLAFIDETEREAALQRELPKRSPASLTDPQALRDEAARHRGQGWALGVDDFVIGLTGLGVPIFDARKQLIGALAISGLTSVFAAAPEPPHLQALKQAAAAIGAKSVSA